MSTTHIEQALDQILLATWQRERDNDELRSFVDRHAHALSLETPADVEELLA